MASTPIRPPALCILACCFLLLLPDRVLGQHFTNCHSAASNATILIPKTVSTQLGANHDTLQAGDEIAVFTKDGVCAGVGRWSSTNLIIAAAGTNSQESEGYESGDSFDFKVWDASANTTYQPEVTYQACDGSNPLCRNDGRYQPDALYTLSRISTGGGEALKVTQTAASAEQDSHVAANTLDDDLSTRWSAYGRGKWVQFELSNETTLKQIGIAWYRGSERRAEFEIALSADGTHWTTVHQGSSSGTTRGREYYNFTATRTKYVRITGRGNTENKWNAITEVDVGGSNRGGSASKSLAQTIEQPIEEAVPEGVTLAPNYPNPFRQSTTIQYTVPQRSHVLLEVFDALGRQVALLVDRQQQAGQHEVSLTTENWSSGVYIYRLHVAGKTRTGRMTIVR